jgi:hypothetical protein
MDRCAPNYADGTVSCFSKDVLVSIITLYNNNYADKIQIGSGANKRDLWEAIQAKMSKRCGKDETCWIEQGFLKKIQPDLEEYFKPLAPLGRYQWLSTDDINSVMRQYAEKYRDFKFVGPLPMDFMTLRDKDSQYLQKLDLNREAREYRNIGVIFNMDPSTQNGSHWVALNIDLIKKEIQYFDSYGNKSKETNEYRLPYYDSYGEYHKEKSIPMPLGVQKFVFQSMKNLISNGLSSDPSSNGVKMPYTLRINSIQHQYANSECGIYSMLFLLKSRNNSFDQITQDIITDEVANQARNTLFRRK